MIILLSPAKKMLVFNKPYSDTDHKATTPLFHEKTMALIRSLQALSTPDLARLMHLSPDLAKLNYQRYQSFDNTNTPTARGYPAVFLFQGDVYKTLQAEMWDKKALQFAQDHLVILSGLYGLLRPLDLIQPYRLEMGTSLANAYGKNIYAVWRDPLTAALNHQLLSHTNRTIINLASQEYFNAVDLHHLNSPVITIHFKEHHHNQLKVIGIHAKKARGAMANYMIQNKIDEPEKIKSFDLLGYQYCAASSDVNNFNFIR